MISFVTVFRGKLRDTVLDWEDELPYEDLQKADYHSKSVTVDF